MGAREIYYKIQSENIHESIDQLREDAAREHGDDIYNGTITTVRSIQHVKISDRYSESAEKKAKSYLKKCELGKREAVCLDLGVTSYRKYTIEKKNYDAKPEYKLKFVLRTDEGKKVASADTKTQANKLATKYIMDYPNTDIYISKEYVNTGKSAIVSQFSARVKNFKAKPKNMEGVKEVHTYIIYGSAAE